jgi:hypothetical protein
MTDVERLARIIQSCNNPVKIGIRIGRVAEAPPEEEKVKIAVKFRGEDFVIEDFWSLCGSTFKKGDKVAVQFSDNNQTVYVLGAPLFVGNKGGEEE